jgi:hypothetical protein
MKWVRKSRYGVVVLVKIATKVHQLFKKIYLVSRSPTDSHDITLVFEAGSRF